MSLFQDLVRALFLLPRQPDARRGAPLEAATSSSELDAGSSLLLLQGTGTSGEGLVVGHGRESGAGSRMLHGCLQRENGRQKERFTIRIND